MSNKSKLKVTEGDWKAKRVPTVSPVPMYWVVEDHVSVGTMNQNDVLLIQQAKNMYSLLDDILNSNCNVSEFTDEIESLFAKIHREVQ